MGLRHYKGEKMTTLKCRNCGGTVELDTELPVAFCPYCGKKDLIDDDLLGRVYIEKEKTRQTTAKLDYEERKNIREQKQQRFTPLIPLVFLLICFLMVWLSTDHLAKSRKAEADRLLVIEQELIDAYQDGDYDLARIKANQLRPDGLSYGEERSWNAKRKEYLAMIDKAEKEVTKTSG